MAITPAGSAVEMQETRPTGYAWLVVGLLWGVALLNYMDRQMLSTMQTQMGHDIWELNAANKISGENFGRLMGIFLWIYGLMSPAAGLIADRINRKWLIVGSLGVWSAVTLAMGYAADYNTLYALRAVMGVSEALYIPAGLALIADYHQGATRSLAIGIHMTGLYCGAAMGGVGAVFSSHFSWQKTFHVFGLVGVGYGLLLAFLLKEHRTDKPASPAVTAAKPAKANMFASLGMLLGMISFWAILFCFAAPSFPGWATKNWLPTLFAHSLGIEDKNMAKLYATITISAASFVGVFIGGILSDRWSRANLRGRTYTSAIGLSLTIPALLLLGLCSGIVPIIGGGILFGVGFGMFDANNMPILCQFVSPRHRAAGYGLMNMVGVFSGAAVTELLGKYTDKGQLGGAFALLAVPVALAAVIFLCLRPSTINKTAD